MPLSAIREDIPAMFRRAAIHAALGSARSFSAHLKRWRTRKQKALSRGKTFTDRPPVPPRTWNKAVPFYAESRKERTANSKETIYFPGKACGSSRAWHRSGGNAQDG